MILRGLLLYQNAVSKLFMFIEIISNKLEDIKRKIFNVCKYKKENLNRWNELLNRCDKRILDYLSLQ